MGGSVQLRIGEPTVREDRFRRSLNRILRRTVLCSISTVSSAGRAHVNTAYFAVSSDLELYFLSDPLSQHARNIRRNPSAAVAVFDSHQTWGKADRGAQLFGRCTQAEEGVAVKAADVYACRFPRFSRWSDRLAADAPARKWKFFEFVPSVVKVLDEVTFRQLGFVRASVIR